MFVPAPMLISALFYTIHLSLVSFGSPSYFKYGKYLLLSSSYLLFSAMSFEIVKHKLKNSNLFFMEHCPVKPLQGVRLHQRNDFAWN